jgi:hypothetical protein
LVNANTLFARMASPTVFAGYSGNNLDPIANFVTDDIRANGNNLTRYFVPNNLRWLEAGVSVMKNLGVCSAGGTGFDPDF